MTVPFSWSRQRLGRVARTIGGSGFPPEHQGLSDGDLPFAKVSDIRFPGNESGIRTAANYVSRAQARQLAARIIPPGSVVFPKVGAALLGNARARTLRECLVDNNMMAVVPHAGDPRYWLYLLSTIDLAELSPGGPLPYVTEAQVRDVRVSVPPPDEQRRIADFLDVEAQKIDRQLSLLARLKILVSERETAVLGLLLTPGHGLRQDDRWLQREWRWKPLGHLTPPSRPIMYGIVLPGPNVDDGVPIVKGGDIAGRRLRVDALCRTTREIEAGYKRSRLRGGDLVIAIRGSVGEVECVPEELTGANLTQDAARIAVGREVHGRWLELVLQAPSVVEQIQSRITGATIKGINIWDLKRVLIPTPLDTTEQVRLAVEVDRELALHERLMSRVKRQRSLLMERRQALIAAAVTGQIDVTTARGVDV